MSRLPFHSHVRWLKRGTWHSVVNNYCVVASAGELHSCRLCPSSVPDSGGTLLVVFLLYEYVITLDREVNSFWLGAPTGAYVLFLSNRYFNVAINVLGLIEFGHLSDQVGFGVVLCAHVDSDGVLSIVEVRSQQKLNYGRCTHTAGPEAACPWRGDSPY